MHLDCSAYVYSDARLQICLAIEIPASSANMQQRKSIQCSEFLLHSEQSLLLVCCICPAAARQTR